MKNKLILVVFLFFCIQISGTEIRHNKINILYRTDIAFPNDSSWRVGVTYPYVISLQHSCTDQNNVLLATYDVANRNSRDGNPIYRSLDMGKTWHCIAVIRDPQVNLSTQWMPMLFELPRDFGNMKAGTILLTACSIDPAQEVLSLLRLYKSENGGEDWELVGTIAEGGGLKEVETGVWEPFLVMLKDGTMACYYADCTERDNHSQKIVYKTSKNGINWSSPVDVVATSDRTDRPGMPVVTHMGDNRYFLVYEMKNEIPEAENNRGIIYCKTSSDGLNWGKPALLGQPIIADGKMLGAAPYCAWSPQGSPKGTLFISGTYMSQGNSDTGTDYFISHDYGATFQTIPHVLPYKAGDYVGYRNSISFSPDGKLMYAVNCINNPDKPGKNKITFALAELVSGASALQENKPSEIYDKNDMFVQEINEGWTFRQVSKQTVYPATVPGCIHTDLLNQGFISDPYFRTNEKDVQWIDKEDWEYRTTFILSPEILAKENIILDFKGLDTYAEIVVNNHSVLVAENMFREWVVDIKPYAKERNELKVIFYSPVKKALPLCDSIYNKYGFIFPQWVDNSQVGGLGDKRISVFTRKAPYQYGWDWGPRLVTSGIWRPVYIEAWNTAHIDDLHLTQSSLTKQLAVINAGFTIISSKEKEAEVVLTYKDSGVEFARLKTSLRKGENHVTVQARIENPELWWPNGAGKQHLYSIQGTLLVNGRIQNQISHRIGLRTVELVQQPDEKGNTFYFRVNGVPMFMKGANYIPNDLFLTRVSDSKYENVVLRAKNANMNMLRVWGGGIYENDIFYDLCDRHGILIWQDFIFAGSPYPIDATFLTNVKEEVVDNIKRLRNHPCLAIWCGNNEMTEGWYYWGWKDYPMKYPGLGEKLWEGHNALFYDLLPKVCAQYDPQRYYWPSSPQSGYDRPATSTSGDLHYWAVLLQKKPLSEYEKIIPRFSSEYGFISFPEMRTVKTFTNSSDWDILSEVMKEHQRFTDGNAFIKKYLEQYYRLPEKFEHYLYLSQLLHADANRIAEEAYRRAMPYCMGSLVWMLNDVWPANTFSTTDYYGRWKAPHYTAKKAYSETLVSPYMSNDTLHVSIVTDRMNDINAELHLKVMDLKGKEIVSSVVPVVVKANTAQVYFKWAANDILKNEEKSQCFLYVEITEKAKSLSDHFYYFTEIKNLNLPKVQLKKIIRPILGGYEIVLKTNYLAKNVYLYTDMMEGFFSDNFFDMLPNKEYKITFATTPSKVNLKDDLFITTVRDTYK